MQDLPVNTDISNHTIVDYPIKDKREINENMFSTLELDEEYCRLKKATSPAEWEKARQARKQKCFKM